jgi:hypothetical protein
MRERLRYALARLDVLEKERIGQSSGLKAGAAAATDSKRKYDDNNETSKRASKRVCRSAVKNANYADDSSVSDNDGDSDFEVVEPPVPNANTNKPKITLQRKSVVSYHGVKRKRLVELCSNEGLPTTGTDADLKKRHSDFITLYNSECDAEHPREVGELVKEIKRRESGRKVCPRVIYYCNISRFVFVYSEYQFHITERSRLSDAKWIPAP